MSEYFGLGGPPSKPIDRNEVIEECARVAENHHYLTGDDRAALKAAAAAIRALKDKP